MNIVLWILQALLSLFFLFAGGLKLVMSSEAMAKMAPPNAIQLPGPFMKFIGVCEALMALGLVLPGLTKIRRGLTPFGRSWISNHHDWSGGDFDHGTGC